MTSWLELEVLDMYMYLFAWPSKKQKSGASNQKLKKEKKTMEENKKSPRGILPRHYPPPPHPSRCKIYYGHSRYEP